MGASCADKRPGTRFENSGGSGSPPGPVPRLPRPSCVLDLESLRPRTLFTPRSRSKTPSVRPTHTLESVGPAPRPLTLTLGSVPTSDRTEGTGTGSGRGRTRRGRGRQTNPLSCRTTKYPVRRPKIDGSVKESQGNFIFSHKAGLCGFWEITTSFFSFRPGRRPGPVPSP